MSAPGKCPDCGGEVLPRVDRPDYECRECHFVLSHAAFLSVARRPIDMSEMVRIADLLPRAIGHKDAALRRKFYVSPYSREDE